MEWINANKKQPERDFNVIITDGIRFGSGYFDDSIDGDDPWNIKTEGINYVKFWCEITPLPDSPCDG